MTWKSPVFPIQNSAIAVTSYLSDVRDDFETFLQFANANLQKNTAVAGVESGGDFVLFFSIQSSSGRQCKFINISTLSICFCA